jgi:S-DNA-T family DNA segregation ATPase FtsK/SpoIIIE
MTTRTVRRVPRVSPPRLPGGELALEPPPEPARPVPVGLGQRLLPAAMLLGSIGIVAVMGVNNPQGWLFGGMIALSTLGMLAGGLGRGGADRAETDENRRDYLRYLAQVRARIRVVEADQRSALSWSHPEPAALAAVLGTDRMWERRTGDPDFGQVRVAVGRQRLATRLVAPQTGPLNELEPVCAWALRRLIRAHSVVPELPVAVALAGEVRRVSLAPFAIANDRPGNGPGGNPAAAVARAMIAQYVVWHSPAEARLVVVAAEHRGPTWDWVKWLPHAAHPTLTDDIGPLRMVTDRAAEVGGWLDGMASPVTPPRVLVVVDGVDVRRSGAQWLDRPEVTVLNVAEPEPGPAATPRRGTGTRLERGELRLLVAPDRIGTAPEQPESPPSWIGRPDRMGVPEVEALARRLARYRAPLMAEPEAGTPLRGTVGLPELLGIGGPDAVPAARARWRGSPSDALRVPIGLGEAGEPVSLDLKESARGGSGPHGLCIGATGSGKSELLRTLVLGLAATHSSERLNMVLIDFKGGATFLGLADLPHVAAVITNLADELSLVDRMAEALAGEINRRQEVLRAAGNVASVHEYERLRRSGRGSLAPLPALFIVIDEFSELLAQRPELIDLLVGIGRLGRSLEIHLLLASQRLDEGRLRGLESHLSYRIALRTFSPAESRAVLGVPDAHHLPPMPGSGYLALGTDELVRFRAAYVSAPPGPAAPGAPVARSGIVAARPRPFTAARVGPPPAELAAATTMVLDAVRPDGAQPESPAATVLDEMVAAIATGRVDPPAHEVWLPPLDEPPPLDELLGPLTVSDRGLGTADVGELRVPVGLIDRPYHQRWDPLVADLSGAAGHAVVVGGPQAGKSTLLRTLVLGLALTHTPREVSVFGLDFGGGLLAGLSGLPHVAGVADRQRPHVVRRTVAEVVGLLADRERTFREAGVDSVAEFRRRRAAGELDDPHGADPHGDVFLLVDGYLTLRSEFEDLEAELLPLASRGLSYGIHLVVSANRWSELRPALKDLLGTRFELRLGDPADSEIDRRKAAGVPARPGRGLAPDGAQCVIARPGLRTVGEASGSGGTEFADTVAAVAEAWAGPPVPGVRLLPERLPYPELVAGPAEPPSASAVPIGIDETRLAPVWLDFAHDPHLLCFADAESGKTTLLRVLARGLVDRLPPERARIVQLDYRRTLLGAVPDSHRIGYASTTEAASALITDVVGSLRRRLPGPDVTSAQLRDRSWWTGPEVYVLVDDYDLVSGSGGAPNPLTPLLEFLPQAKDVGLHLVLARRSGGAGRALFDPVISRLRELATPGLLLSGSPDEGPLLDGVKLSPQPPGRGVLLDRRSGRRRVQLALLEETLPDDEPDAEPDAEAGG